MKQLESKTVAVGENTFYIRPFPAFKASNIFGQLAKTVTPVIGGVLSLAGEGGEKGGSLFDIDFDKAAPALAGALSDLSGDKLEALLKQLLIDYKNVSTDDPSTGRTVNLTEDLANEIFCGDIQDMLILAMEVVKLNYSGFFSKLAAQFGGAFESLQARMKASTAGTAS